MENTKKKKILTAVIIVFAILVAGVTIAIPTLYSCGMLLSVHPMKVAKDGQIRVACVGDSITYGHAVSNWTKNSYPVKLGNKLGDDYCVNNFGYSDRTAMADGNHPYTKERLYQTSLEFNPDVVIIMLGTNDTKPYNWKGIDAYKENYGKIIDSYLNLGAKVFLLIPPPLFNQSNGVPIGDLNIDNLENGIIPAIQQIAAEKGLMTIDCHTPFVDREDLFPDGCHPNAAGAELFATTVYNGIKDFI